MLDNTEIRFESLDSKHSSVGNTTIFDRWFNQFTSCYWINKIYSLYAHYSRFSISFKFMAFAPFLIFLVFYDLSPIIPFFLRPPISTSILPLLDNILFFGHASYLRHFPYSLLQPYLDSSSLCRILIQFLDLYAAFVYLIHFFTPWIFALFQLLYFRSKRRDADQKQFSEPWNFFFVFGLVNFFALITQLLFPTCPPWWFTSHQNESPTYEQPADPAGLRRADEILGTTFFNDLYSDSPVVFGSFPSMHAAWPLMITVFMPPVKSMKFLGWFYTVSVWWAAPYLDHHYLVDIIGGIFFTFVGCRYGVRLFEYIRRSMGVWAYAKNGEIEAQQVRSRDLEEGGEVVEGVGDDDVELQLRDKNSYDSI